MHTRGKGIRKSENLADIINGCPILNFRDPDPEQQTDLKEGDPVLARDGLPALLADDALVVHVALVAQDHLLDVLVGVLLQSQRWVKSRVHDNDHVERMIPSNKFDKYNKSIISKECLSSMSHLLPRIIFSTSSLACSCNHSNWSN